MNGEAAITTPLIEALQAVHGGLTCRTMTKAWYLPLPCDWNAFLQSVHGKRRNWFRRTWKDFITWVGDKGYAVERARTPDGMRTGMRILAELHAERWHEEGHRGAFASPRFAGFHQEYATRILESGQLDLLWLTVGGKPVAAHYSFVSGGKVYFYQSGRTMGVPANVRLGIVMFILAIQDAMARGLREYDFLGGDSEYKSLFTNLTRPLVEVRVAPPSLRETTRFTLHTAVHAARRLSARMRQFASRPTSTVPARRTTARLDEL
jgi:CelD/BcsL family acetyltransferase involved in cellulose biosynthesis